MDFVISRLSAESYCPSETHILHNKRVRVQEREKLSTHESAELKKVSRVPLLRNKPPAGWRRRVCVCVCRWCVLRPADWHNAVCESSGLLGQHHCQHRPAQRPTGRGSTAAAAAVVRTRTGISRVCARGVRQTPA